MTQIILENQQRCAGISISVYSEKKPENLPELFDVTVKRHAQIIPLITDDLHIEETLLSGCGQNTTIPLLSSKPELI